ncbi:HAD family hydrolase [Thioclava sp. GXIMD4216]|uniref:HAD family hydrolase n=1 Tax=Thioclava sp. GXIMD4216 TaxID=3131929 RepID=UPI0030D27FEF
MLGFDADDTLWQNARFFRLTQERFAELMGEFVEKPHLDARLLAAERRNIGRYGFGVKGFTLSMIETAIEVSEARVDATVIAELLQAGREMLAHPIELLPHVEDTIATLSQDHKLVLITKGDLLDQERKLAQSGLGPYFQAVEVVSEKTAATYTRLFNRHGRGATNGVMVGNSMKSDILPMLQAGGHAVHIPDGAQPWALDHAEPPESHPRLTTLGSMANLVESIRIITRP